MDHLLSKGHDIRRHSRKCLPYSDVKVDLRENISRGRYLVTDTHALDKTRAIHCDNKYILLLFLELVSFLFGTFLRQIFHSSFNVLLVHLSPGFRFSLKCTQLENDTEKTILRGGLFVVFAP